ncbi:hypothetical protein Tco_0259214 [Tanacetum coccineum]
MIRLPMRYPEKGSLTLATFMCLDVLVFNTRRQQIEDTYHVTFYESIEAIKFTNTLVDEIGIDDSSRYPPNEIGIDDSSRYPPNEIGIDDPSRQY